ncbi:MAG TPA: 50S ribosomal protein L11 methyltransferase, partial [Polyangiaceae bacterium]|nr:50S ribosomal protein L11 methyltransferase [Polyangiaceae bacterium]
MALALGAEKVAGTRALVAETAGRPNVSKRRAAGAPPTPATLRAVRDAIRAGEDPLGDALSAARSAEERREIGAIYTPPTLVAAMTEWGARSRPARVVDPGAGSGRFLAAAGARLRAAELVAVDTDPLALLLCAANAAVLGLARRTRVVHGDFRRVSLGRASGSTLFLGNPPYVRHHALSAADKRWLVDAAVRLGMRASQLAGLHVHFFARVAELGRAGDTGALVTAAEWLDVNYGSLVRELLVGPLGVRGLVVVEPRARPFENAETTAVISCFELGARDARVGYRRVASLGALAVRGGLAGGTTVARTRLESTPRWSTLGARVTARPTGYVELGELFRVHRGQVTGKNAVWIAGPHSQGLPASVHFPAITRARELFRAGAVLGDVSALRSVIDLPEDLAALSADERRRVERFLAIARRAGAHEGFVARHRKA